MIRYIAFGLLLSVNVDAMGRRRHDGGGGGGGGVRGVGGGCVPMCMRPEQLNCLNRCGSGRRLGGDSNDDDGPCIEEVNETAAAGTQRNLRETSPTPTPTVDAEARGLTFKRRQFKVRTGRRGARDGIDDGIPMARPAGAELLPICQRMPVSDAKTCFQTVEAEIAPYCREGVYTGSGMCSIQIQQQPEMRCMGDLSSDGSCTMVETTQRVFGCPDGFSPSPIGQMCTSVETETASVMCMEGHEENGQCVSDRPKKCLTPNCVVEIESEVIVSCPPGYVKRLTRTGRERRDIVGLTRDRDVHVDGPYTCEKSEFEVPEDGCPPGTEQESALTCIEYVQETMIESTMSVSPQLTCPIGTHEASFGCVLEDRFRTGQQCAGGVGGSCVVRTARTRMCPPGSRDQHGTCFVMAHTDAIDVDTLVPRGPHLHMPSSQLPVSSFKRRNQRVTPTGDDASCSS